MPLYRFAIHDGTDDAPSDAVDLPDYRAARGEAVRLFGELLKDADGKFWTVGDRRIDVTDGDGLVLCSIFVAGVEAPAVHPA